VAVRILDPARSARSRRRAPRSPRDGSPRASRSAGRVGVGRTDTTASIASCRPALSRGALECAWRSSRRARGSRHRARPASLRPCRRGSGRAAPRSRAGASRSAATGAVALGGLGGEPVHERRRRRPRHWVVIDEVAVAEVNRRRVVATIVAATTVRVVPRSMPRRYARATYHTKRVRAAFASRVPCGNIGAGLGPLWVPVAEATDRRYSARAGGMTGTAWVG